MVVKRTLERLGKVDMRSSALVVMVEGSTLWVVGMMITLARDLNSSMVLLDVMASAQRVAKDACVQ